MGTDILKEQYNLLLENQKKKIKVVVITINSTNVLI